ncbi:hypothetical protein EJ02DRAFT_479412 [Clathrospora elynae]|uniref:Integrase core domain-containing protein n=1 Tax=Clathrospora elynae TaxID=706981 RepID=A0A6A5S9G7_9PLEO|nr:hypothetical protein EJ02DRAFT_479412 [Clathrospora elynae]
MPRHGKGGRPRTDIAPFEDDLRALFEEGLTFRQLADWLYEEHQVRCGLTTLKDRFRRWDIRRCITSDVEQQLKNRIIVLFYQLNLDDSEILRMLHAEGYTNISPATIVRLRFTLGLKHKDEQDIADILAYGLVEEEMKKGIIDGYGRQMLQVHFKQHNMFFSRNRLFKAYCTLNPEAVERRRNDQQRRRGEYIVPGPNWCWSINGHNKLKPYGIQIYACIDAYSRYVIWAYVGVSAATSLSVLHQYLHTVKEMGVYPQFLRSDCGSETGQISYAHFMLSSSHREGITWDDCYMYGTSTANQRIESWWQQLSRGLLFQWRLYFRDLQTTNQFSRDRIPDMVAMIAIYIPVLRRKIKSFLLSWNSHCIRKQKGRPNVITGKPNMLYMCPPVGTEDFKQYLPQDEYDAILQETPPWDMDAILPAHTQTWCDNQLRNIGFNPHTHDLEKPDHRKRPFESFYLELRNCAALQIESGQLPILQLLRAPVGGWDFEVSIYKHMFE